MHDARCWMLGTGHWGAIPDSDLGNLSFPPQADGYLGIWVFRYLGVWVFGCLGIWVFRYLGV